MYQLIEFNFGSQTVLGEFKELPTPSQVKPILAKFDKADKAEFLISNYSLTLNVGHWLALRRF